MMEIVGMKTVGLFVGYFIAGIVGFSALVGVGAAALFVYILTSAYISRFFHYTLDFSQDASTGIGLMLGLVFYLAFTAAAVEVYQQKVKK